MCSSGNTLCWGRTGVIFHSAAYVNLKLTCATREPVTFRAKKKQLVERWSYAASHFSPRAFITFRSNHTDPSPHAPPRGPDSALSNSPSAPYHCSLPIPRRLPPPLSEASFLIQQRVPGFGATINKQLKVALISALTALLQRWLRHKSHTDPEHKHASQHKAGN